LATRLTLDTNLLQEFWRDQQRREVVQRLLELADAGEVELAVTNRIVDDIPGGPLVDRVRAVSGGSGGRRPVGVSTAACAGSSLCV
jgi:hypothetical protein